VSVAGDCVPEDETASQLLPESVFALAVKLTGESVDTAMLPLALVSTPCVRLKLSSCGCPVSAGPGKTVRLTGTVNGLLPAEADITMTEPW
jgi:hypothetical protein